MKELFYDFIHGLFLVIVAVLVVTLLVWLVGNYPKTTVIVYCVLAIPVLGGVLRTL